MSDPNDRHANRSSGPNWSRVNQWVLWLGLAAAVGWMFFRHNAHLLQLLPFLILLACPLMHLFGHGGHGGHGGHSGHAGRHRESDREAPDDDRQPPAGGRGGHNH